MPDSDLNLLQDVVIKGEDQQAKSITETALADGMEPLHIVNEFLIPAMDEVGARFERNEYFVPELLLSARAMKACMTLIRPLLAERGNDGRRCSGFTEIRR